MNEESKKKSRIFWLIPFQAAVGLVLAILAGLTHRILGRPFEGISPAAGLPPVPMVSPETAQGICEALIGAGSFMVVASLILWRHLRKSEGTGVSNNTPDAIRRPEDGSPKPSV